LTVAVQQRLTVVPLKQAEAKAFVSEHHRHHPAPVGGVFQLGVADEDGQIRGVAMVGRPVARSYDDGWTLEVNRVATDGCPNACSALYGASWRAARSLGWRRLITYTLASESGSSLRAAAWNLIGERPGRRWSDSSKSRPRVDTYGAHGQEKLVWEAPAGSNSTEGGRS
jgi:hypothetical protein